MPVCEICGMEVVSVNECECGAKFCDECGDVKRKLCYDCLGWEEEGEKAWGEKEEKSDESDEDLDDADFDNEDVDYDEPN